MAATGRPLHADLVLDALEQALWSRTKIEGLIHHSDRGSRNLSIRYTERLAEADMDASVGSFGNSCDNALAETINGLYKTEVIRRRGPWKKLKRLNMRPWNGWTGLTIAIYLNRSAMCRRLNMK